MSKKLPLTFAVAEMPHTSAVRSGAIPVDGVDGNFLTIHPQIAAFRRMVREVEFDVCELAPTTYIIARAFGAPFVALPIFVLRKFHHSGLLVRPDGGIREPKDLEGHKVGVRAYSVTTGVWSRQALMEDLDVDCSKITWVVDDEEHVTQLTLPSNVQHVPEGRSLYDMMAAGELVAGYGGNAGVGRTGDPISGWKEVGVDYPDLLPNAEALEWDYYRRTGVYPMHGTIVVRESVLKDNPWVAKAIYEAFDEAKQGWLARLNSGEANTASDRRYRKLQTLVGNDPLPYGMQANIRTIQALEETAFKQGLTPRRMALDELFFDPSKV
ncbi:ABC transporter substrate-binding protein [Nitrospirillum iridis]|uniref:4,5-dihydroxyphthalate decarboxylase n=1 Tax=Nitrospirillum iridis TaxID=765888 RepID=A0A7X0EFQ6_9PROT|nr:4,5-dihydroxyphthalate decarboxylase [Nitrospirillum iridis]